VQVGRGRDAGTDVEELAHALLGEVTADPVHEIPVLQHVHAQRAPELHRCVPGRAVDGVVILAPEDVVVDPGAMGAVDPQVHCGGVLSRRRKLAVARS
jgi:hypothetical protein